MKITKKQKIKICFFYLLTFEKLDDFLDLYYRNMINDIYRNNQLYNDLFKKKFKLKPDTQTLAKVNIERLIVETQMLDELTLKSFNDCANKRNDIVHDVASVYLDESIDIEWFKLADLIKTYKNIISQVLSTVGQTIRLNVKTTKVLLDEYAKYVLGLYGLFVEIFKEKKFRVFANILLEPSELSLNLNGFNQNDQGV